MGRLLSRCAHDDLGSAAGAASGRTVYSLCCLLTPSEFRVRGDWEPQKQQQRVGDEGGGQILNREYRAADIGNSR